MTRTPASVVGSGKEAAEATSVEKFSPNNVMIEPGAKFEDIIQVEKDHETYSSARSIASTLRRSWGSPAQR